MVFLEAPLVTEGLEAVGPVVAVEIRDPRDLGLLRDVEGAVAVAHAEDLVESARKAVKAQSRPLLEGAADEVYVASPRADHQPSVRQHVEAPRLEGEPLRKRQVDDAVELLLRGRRAPGPSQRLAVRLPREP